MDFLVGPISYKDVGCKVRDFVMGSKFCDKSERLVTSLRSCLHGLETRCKVERFIANLIY